MKQTTTWLTRVVSGAIALAPVAVSSLTCFLGTAQLAGDAPRMSMAQHACCAGMNQKCPEAASTPQSDCCTTQSVSTPAIQANHVVPPLVVTAVTFVPPIPVAHVSGALDADLLKSSSPPTYLLDVVFRI